MRTPNLLLPGLTAYLQDLSALQSWMFDDGGLVLMLQYDTGTMRFSAGES